jgi:hypothetical protein
MIEERVVTPVEIASASPGVRRCLPAPPRKQHIVERLDEHGSKVIANPLVEHADQKVPPLFGADWRLDMVDDWTEVNESRADFVPQKTVYVERTVGVAGMHGREHGERHPMGFHQSRGAHDLLRCGFTLPGNSHIWPRAKLAQSPDVHLEIDGNVVHLPTSEDVRQSADALHKLSAWFAICAGHALSHSINASVMPS